MCYVAQTKCTFQCGCVQLIEGTVRRCGYAEVAGRDCADFMISADPERSGSRICDWACAECNAKQ